LQIATHSHFIPESIGSSISTLCRVPIHNYLTFRWSIRGLWLTFRTSSQNYRESRFHFCGEEVAMELKHKDFTADVTVKQTL
jgi:hypothetical protein